MTVIAWDGKILAADRQADVGGNRVAVTKIWWTGSHLLFASGDFDRIMAIKEWWERGENPETWPAFQSNDNTFVAFHKIKPDGSVWRYERTPYPYRIEEKRHATGSGRDFALAAMHLGHDAIQAVQTAIAHDPNSGIGIDAFTLDGKRVDVDAHLAVPRNLSLSAAVSKVQRLQLDRVQDPDHDFNGRLTLLFRTTEDAIAAEAAIHAEARSHG